MVLDKIVGGIKEGIVFSIIFLIVSGIIIYFILKNRNKPCAV